LTHEEYKGKYDYEKSQTLTCKTLTHLRRYKMKTMKLWELKGNLNKTKKR